MEPKWFYNHFIAEARGSYHNPEEVVLVALAWFFESHVVREVEVIKRESYHILHFRSLTAQLNNKSGGTY